MASQYWLRPYSGCMSLVLLLSPAPSTLNLPHSSIRHSPASSSQAQKTAPALANTIAQSCTNSEIEQYVAAFRDAWQQESAVRQLVSSCGQSATPALTRVLQTESDAGVRQTAAAALGYIGGGSATKTLIAMLSTDPTPMVRQTVADALGYIRDASAVNPLIATLKKMNEDPAVRQATAEALGNIGGTIATDALITTLKNTKESLNLRQAAVEALQKIREPATDALVLALQASDLRTRYWTVAALSEINSPRSIKALEANKVKVTQILEAAYKADIVEFDRAPAGLTSRASGANLARKPIVCRIKWITQYWGRCH